MLKFLGKNSIYEAKVAAKILSSVIGSSLGVYDFLSIGLTKGGLPSLSSMLNLSASELAVVETVGGVQSITLSGQLVTAATATPAAVAVMGSILAGGGGIAVGRGLDHAVEAIVDSLYEVVLRILSVLY